MQTEHVDPRYRGLDTWPNAKILDAMLAAQQAAITAIAPARQAIADAVDAAVPRLAAGGRLAYAGAGTSARLAVQDGTELIPTFAWPAERLVFLISGGLAALTSPSEGSEDDAGAAADAVAAANIAETDVLFAVAASGATPYTIGACTAAKTAGALTIAVANNPGSPLLACADHAILIETGPEVIAGSTRLAAGTGQKAVLNMLSTLIMVRLGKVYDGLMVDVLANNAKLRDRAQRMVATLADVAPEAAASALTAANGHVKTAVLVAKGLTPQAATAALSAAGGNLRDALATL